MADVLTIEQINAQFPDEWVLLDELRTDQFRGVQAGKVLAHDKDRDEICRRATSFMPGHFAIFYTGSTAPAEGTEFVL